MPPGLNVSGPNETACPALKRSMAFGSWTRVTPRSRRRPSCSIVTGVVIPGVGSSRTAPLARALRAARGGRGAAAAGARRGGGGGGGGGALGGGGRGRGGRGALIRGRKPPQ